MTIHTKIAAFEDLLISWRHALHQHPEICYEEVWTSDFIADKLASFGIEVVRGLGQTGLVGILHGTGYGPDNPGPAIGLRADMDALPMTEANDFAHRSQIEGRMHACGHDGHVTMLLGAAKYLAETRDFAGTVYFIFQPAEEGGAGGQAMIDDGLFDRFEMRSVWGMHNWPGLPTGHIAVHHGPCMASADHFEITINGRGGHAAMPHQSVDPVVASAAIIQSLQTIVARKTDPLDAAVLSITQMNAGSAFNVIPDQVVLCGTARALTSDTRQFLEDQIKLMIDQIAKAYGCHAEIDWRVGYPPTVNDSAMALRAADVAGQLVGPDKLHQDIPASMGAEDFAFMLDERPGAYIWLGAGEAIPGKMLHNTGYDFNDSILSTGASYWVRLVESELSNGPAV